MPRKTAPKGAQIYIAAESFVANVDGVDRQYHEGRTRVYEGDPILERTPEDWWFLLEDHNADTV